MLSNTIHKAPAGYWETQEWVDAVQAAFLVRMELFEASHRAPNPDDFLTYTVWRAACAEYDAAVMAPIRERLAAAAAARDAIANQATR